MNVLQRRAWVCSPCSSGPRVDSVQDRGGEGPVVRSMHQSHCIAPACKQPNLIRDEQIPCFASCMAPAWHQLVSHPRHPAAAVAVAASVQAVNLCQDVPTLPFSVD